MPCKVPLVSGTTKSMQIWLQLVHMPQRVGAAIQNKVWHLPTASVKLVHKLLLVHQQVDWPDSRQQCLAIALL